MRGISLVLVAFLLVGCDDDGGSDAGVGTDAGPMVDSGAIDGGGPMDSGADAGPPGDDAGTDGGAPADGGADASSDAGPGLPVGTSGCTMDSDCTSGVCWDFSDYDSLCFGTVCSVTCTRRMDCFVAAMNAGASDQSRATCGTDGRCDFVGTGLGIWACSGR